MLFDLLAIFLSLGVFVVYHIYFWVRIFDQDGYSSRHLLAVSSNLRNAKLWVTKHHSQAEDNSSILLAVHTLRNTILVGIFVGGSSFTFLLQTLGSVTSLEREGTIFIRSIVLGLFFSLSFLCWTTVIRCAGIYFYHAFYYFYFLYTYLFYKKQHFKAKSGNKTNNDTYLMQFILYI